MLAIDRHYWLSCLLSFSCGCLRLAGLHFLNGGDCLLLFNRPIGDKPLIALTVRSTLENVTSYLLITNLFTDVMDLGLSAKLAGPIFSLQGGILLSAPTPFS